MHADARLVTVVVALLAGCSSIPPGGDPGSDPSLAGLAGPPLGRLAVAPITTLALATDEEAKGWRTAETDAIDPDAVRRDLLGALQATRAFERVRATGADAALDAWSARDDLLVHLSVRDLRTRFDGHNGWWIPNILNWLFWMVPAWWVATEEYSLHLEADIEVRSAESGAALLRLEVPVEVAGTFDEFDRGWQFFGFIYPSLDGEGWRGIATKLFPAAQRQLAVASARAVVLALREAAEDEAAAAARRKTLVLAVGVERYVDSTRFPPQPYVSSDARAVVDALRGAGVRPEHVALLLDGGATADAVRGAFAGHLSRARAGDRVLVYVAGLAERTRAGAGVLLHDAAAEGAGGRLSFKELAALLAQVDGDKLLVLDVGLGGGQRAVVADGAPDDRDDAAVLSDVPGLQLLIAGGAAEPALAPEHLTGGLLTHHLTRGLEGAADADGDGRLTPRELFAYAHPRVVAEAALLGAPQRPRLLGPATPFVLTLTAQRHEDADPP